MGLIVGNVGKSVGSSGVHLGKVAASTKNAVSPALNKESQVVYIKMG